jgi:hypothetical protein
LAAIARLARLADSAAAFAAAARAIGAPTVLQSLLKVAAAAAFSLFLFSANRPNTSANQPNACYLGISVSGAANRRFRL